MAQNGTGLTSRQRALMEALLTGKSTKDAAISAGVSVRTGFRWQADPAFRAELHAAENALIDAGMHRLLALQATALDRLVELLAADAAVTPTERLRAISLALDGMLRLRELRAVQERVAELEGRLGALEGDHENRDGGRPA